MPARTATTFSPRFWTHPTPAPIREATVHHALIGMFAIRRGDWKLILGRGSGGFTLPQYFPPKPGEPEGQLYNLATTRPKPTTSTTRRPRCREPS